MVVDKYGPQPEGDGIHEEDNRLGEGEHRPVDMGLAEIFPGLL